MGRTLPQQLVHCKSMWQHVFGHPAYNAENKGFSAKLTRNVFAGSI
jgi:hypothetical protein